jgi:hypothetical protein
VPGELAVLADDAVAAQRGNDDEFHEYFEGWARSSENLRTTNG